MSDHNGERDHVPPPPIAFDAADIYRVIDALAFREIDHHGVEGEGAHEIRRAIEPLLTELLFALHDSRAIEAGTQWTIPVGLDCGFEGDLIVRVRQLGPDHATARRERQ
jgi:hypothetical protein